MYGRVKFSKLSSSILCSTASGVDFALEGLRKRTDTGLEGLRIHFGTGTHSLWDSECATVLRNGSGAFGN